MRTKKVAGALALALLLVTACNAGDEDTISMLRDDTATFVLSRQNIELEIQPAGPIKLGKNTVIVKFPRNLGAELLSVSAFMPAHGHGSPAPKIERRDDGGFVIRDLVFYMSGRWELRLALRVGAREDEAIVAVDVP